MSEPAVKIEFATKDFFFIPMKKVEIETVPETGRVYFIFQDRIVAVAKRGETDVASTDRI